MNTDRAALEAAHVRLSAAVRQETAKAYRTNRAPHTPPHLVYRSHMATAPSPATMRALGRIANGLANQFQAQGYTVHRGGTEGREDGHTDWRTKEVHIATTLQPQYEVAVMIHELAHIRLQHFDRMAMGTPRGLTEVEAESVAYLVASALGLDSETCCATYIAQYAKGNMDLLRMSASRCIKVAEAILEEL